jgi:hypothetical protein
MVERGVVQRLAPRRSGERAKSTWCGIEAQWWQLLYVFDRMDRG